MRKRKGFTLIELLCVLGVLAILSTISVPVLKTADQKSKERRDNAMVLVWNQAFEAYRWNDYSTLTRTDVKNVTFEENGRVKVSSALHMNAGEVALLTGSGKGVYPKTREECIAMIKLYTGSTEGPGYPAKGANYDFYYNKTTGIVTVLRDGDIPPGYLSNYIVISGD